MSFRKTFDGLDFQLREIFNTRSKANDYANKLRRNGYYARIELHRDKHTHKDMWAVYSRYARG